MSEQKFNNALEADAHTWDTRELDRPELREKIARAICCFAKDNKCCAECKYNTPKSPFPDCFCDIRENTDQILALFSDETEAISYCKGVLDGKKQERKDIGEWLLEEYDATPTGKRMGLLEDVITKLVDGQALGKK